MEVIGIRLVMCRILRRDKYVDLFFSGYKDHPDGKDGSMIWDGKLAGRTLGLIRRERLDRRKGQGRRGRRNSIC